MIFQLHWQNPNNINETKFVCQGETEEIERESGDIFEEWIIKQYNKFKNDRPDGWIPMICWGDHPAMVVKA